MLKSDHCEFENICATYFWHKTGLEEVFCGVVSACARVCGGGVWWNVGDSGRIFERLPATGGAQIHSEGEKLKTNGVDGEGGLLLTHKPDDVEGASAGRTGAPGEAAATAT